MTSIWKPLKLVIFAFSLFAVLYLTFFHFSSDTILFTDDGAFAYTLGKKILGGETILTGLPSHLGGRHVGPLYLWYTALGLFFGNGDPIASTIILSAIKFSALLIIALTVVVFLGSSTSLAGISGALLCAASGVTIWLLRIPWANHFLLLPSALLFLSAFLVFRFGGALLFVFVTSASMAFQAHLSSAPVIAALSLTIIAHLVFGERSHESLPAVFRGRTFQILCVVILSILWIPPAIYEFQFESNLKNLLVTHGSSGGGSGGIALAGTYALQFTQRILFGVGGYARVSSLFSPWSLTLIGLSAAILFVHLFLSFDANRRWMIAAAMASGISILALLSSLTPPIHHYYLNSLASLPLLICGLIFSHAIRLLNDKPEEKTPLSMRIPALVFAAGFLVLSIFSIYRNYIFYAGSPISPLESMLHASEVASIIEGDRHQGEPVKIFVRGDFKLRKNAIYYFLNGDHFHMMQYHSVFKELTSLKDRPSHGRPHAGVDESLIPARGYLLQCNTKSDRKIARKAVKHWKLDEKLALTKCSTCTGCTLNRLRRAEASGH